MDYHHVDPSALDPSALDPPSVRPWTTLSVGGACGLERFAARVHAVDTGEAFVLEPGSSRFASVPAGGDSTTVTPVGEPPVDGVRASEES